MITDQNDSILKSLRQYKIGFGTWRLGDGAKTTDAVFEAINAGYRKFDCAYSYGNDFFVGKALKKSGIERENFSVTNKVWNTFETKEQVIDCCLKSLKLMKLSYFDLYLIHWPVDKSNPNWKQINFVRWQGMEELYEKGLVKAIGLSNFDQEQVDALLSMDIKIKPMVNQIEFHPGYSQKELVEYCQSLGIEIEAYSPLGSGNVFSNPTLITIAKKYNKTIAQICLRWEIQNNVVPLPRAEDVDKIKENYDVFDFEISNEDMNIISNITDINGNLFK